MIDGPADDLASRPSSPRRRNRTRLPENFGAVALKIEEALAEYRTADDGSHPQSRSFHGIRYAATRADVVAHSMGGLLAKWYIAKTNIPGGSQPRPGFPAGFALQDVRWPWPDHTGRWPYLRPDNWGAGSIRRLITIGTPFNGSPITTNLANVFLPGPGGLKNPSDNFRWAENYIFGKQAYREYWIHLFPSGNASSRKNYAYPTGLSDVDPGCVALSILGSSTYPEGDKQTRWFPIVGLASPGVNTPQAIFDCKYPPGGMFGWKQNAVRNHLINHGLGPNHQWLPNASSDLTVPVDSQRNLTAVTPQNASAGEPVMEGITHGYYGECVRQNPSIVVPGEPDSLDVRARILELLQGGSSPFSSAWSFK